MFLYLFTFYLFYTCVVPGIELRLSSLTIDTLIQQAFSLTQEKYILVLDALLRLFSVWMDNLFLFSRDLDNRIFLLLKQCNYL